MSNIYRVINEEHIGEILRNNRFKLVTVAITSKLNDHEGKIKRCLINLSRQYVNSIFLYVDVNQYEHHNVILIDTLPTTIVFFNGCEFYRICGQDINSIIKCVSIGELKSRQITLRALSAQQPVQQLSQLQHPLVQQQPEHSPVQQSQLQQPEHSAVQQPQQPQLQQPEHSAVQQPQQPQLQKHTVTPPATPTKKKRHNKQDIGTLIGKLEVLQETKKKEEEIIGVN